MLEIIHGTLHLVLGGKKRVVVCSDSRGHSKNGPSTENFQKLFQAGRRTLCGTHGVLMLAPDIYVSDRISRFCNDKKYQDSPQQILAAIRDDMRDPLFDLFNAHPLPDGPSVFGALAISRKRTGELSFWKLDFPIVEKAPKVRSIAEPTIEPIIEGMPQSFFHFAEARGDCLPVNFTKMVHPDNSEAEILRGVDEIFSLIAASPDQSCRNEVGGPIDVAVIDAVGVSWLRRK